MKKLIVLTLISFLLIETNLLSKSEITISKEQAYNIALDVAGFSTKDRLYTKSLADEIKLVKISKDSILEWGKEISDREVWVVQLKKVELILPGWTESAHANQKKKTFSFFIDSKTSQIIKISAQMDTTTKSFMNKINKSSWKKLLYSNSMEEWVGFPDSLPKISLQKALLSAVPSSPLKAEEIYCTCVYYKELDHKPRLVWQIIGIGLPDSKIFGKRVKSIVDAITGKLISAGSF